MARNGMLERSAALVDGTSADVLKLSVSTSATEIEEFRRYSDAPVNTAVYTHGHTDHVGGAEAFDADAAGRGHRRITYVGHEAIPARFSADRRVCSFRAIVE